MVVEVVLGGEVDVLVVLEFLKVPLELLFPPLLLQIDAEFD